jgi:hypothetical protein
VRLIRMRGRGRISLNRLHHQPAWQRAMRLVRDYEAFPLLDMDI